MDVLCLEERGRRLSHGDSLRSHPDEGRMLAGEALRGEARFHAPASTLRRAPHPNPLPAGEREQRRQATLASTLNLPTSRNGGASKRRLYSRLNCDGLS